MHNSYTALAAVYDALMYDVDYDAWAAYVDGLLGGLGLRGGRIAETACGTGNVTVRLARMGYRMTASDASAAMLARAGDKARAAGVKPMFVRQDMRRLCVPTQDAVLCCCDGVNYLRTPQEVQAFFAAAYICLKPGGALLFDVSSAYKLRHVLGDQFFYEDGDDVTYFWQNAFDAQTDCVTMNITLFTRNADGSYARADETHIQRAHTAQELLEWLSRAGFAQTEVYAFGTREAPGEKTERLQFAARKF